MTKLTKEDINRKLHNRWPNENLICLEYITAKQPAKIKCNTCGTIYNFQRAENLFRKKGYFCPKCNDTSEWAKTKEQFLKWLETSNFQLIDNLGEIHDSQVHIHCKCKSCGRIQEGKNAYDYMKGIECYCKTKSVRKTEDTLQTELGDEYIFNFKEYINTDTKMHFTHKKCGYNFLAAPRDLLRYKGFCPCCNFHKSHGEAEVETVLKKSNIIFQRQYRVTIEDHTYRFDFYLPFLKTAIEYNGIQHYYPVEHFGGQKEFKKRQLYDKIKTKWCQDNDIKEIIIKYNEDVTTRLHQEGVV